MTDLQETHQDLPTSTVSILGIPFDGGASFKAGQSLAPHHIRAGLYSDSTNLCAENGLDLSIDPGWQDVGDLEISSGEIALTEIERGIEQNLGDGKRVLSLGGDHSITYPILRAYAKTYPKLSVLQLDAHSDLYDEFDGNRYSHASPFARVMEEKLVAKLTQVGIRTLTPHQREQADRFGVEIIEMRDWTARTEIEVGENLYLSLDLDVLDPAHAPGVSHHEPGGMTTRDVIRIIQGLRGNIIGADIVEYTPERDVEGMTAMVAAKLLKEILVRMLGQVT